MDYRGPECHGIRHFWPAPAAKSLVEKAIRLLLKFRAVASRVPESSSTLQGTRRISPFDLLALKSSSLAATFR
jgi:hypothetical protein